MPKSVLRTGLSVTAKTCSIHMTRLLRELLDSYSPVSQPFRESGE